MKPTAADWPELLRLLEQAQAHDETALPQWLASLPAPRQQQLQALLDQRRSIETQHFLEQPARLLAAGDAGGPAMSAGQRVGPWRLLQEIGRGGMAWVWLAERADGHGQRRVALKLPRLGWAPGLAERMARERDILATLEHPNIARLYDAGVDEQGRPWLALEYVQGQPIDTCAKAGALTVHQRVALLLQVCDAVAYAHSRLAIHRDLKPANILVTEAGQVKLLDFGIAKLVQAEGWAAQQTALTELAGTAMTLRYASPEQLRGEPLGTASDVYSLGVVAYELLAGASPYGAPGDAAALRALIERGDLPLASAVAQDSEARQALSGDLDAVLARAMSLQPRQRYAHVAALAQELQQVLAGRPVTARRRHAAERLWRQVQRSRAPLLAAAGVVAALTLGLGLGPTSLVLAVAAAGTAAALIQARRAQRSRTVADAATRRAELVRDTLLQVFNVGHWPQDGRRAHEITLKEALDQVRHRLSVTMAHLPADQAIVLDAVAAVYEQLDLAPDSLALLDQALAALDAAGTADAAHQPLRLRLLKRRLSAAFMHQRFEGFDSVLARLEMLLDSQAGTDNTDRLGGERAAALYYRVRRQQMLGPIDVAEVAAKLTRAESLYARHAPAEPTRQHALSLAVQALLALDRLDEAERLASTQLELSRRAPDSAASVGNALSVRGAVRLRQQRWLAAREDLQGAHADYLKHSGPEHMLTAQNEVFLGHAIVGGGEVTEGLAIARRGAAVICKLRSGQPKEAQTLERLAAAELQAGEVAAALATLRRALAVWQAHPDLAATLRAEALALAAVALATLEQADEAATLLQELDAVLADAAPASPRHQMLRTRAADALLALRARKSAPA
jgi:eukaryotic-like serine/threonine-protein kinase